MEYTVNLNDAQAEVILWCTQKITTTNPDSFAGALKIIACEIETKLPINLELGDKVYSPSRSGLWECIEITDSGRYILKNEENGNEIVLSELSHFIRKPRTLC